MGINKKKTLVIFLIFNAFVLVLSFGFYFMFMDTFAKVHTDKYLTTMQNVVKDTTNEKIEGALNVFDVEASMFSLVELNSKVNQPGDIGDYNFVEFVDVNNNEFVFAGNTVKIIDSYLRNYRFGFFGEYLYLFNDDIAGVIDFNALMKQVLFFTHANDLVVMSNQGEIYYNLKPELYKNVLYEYINEDAGEYISDYFSVNKEVIIYSNFTNGKAVIKFTPLESFNNLYVGQQFYEKDITLSYSSVSMFLLLLFIILGFLNVTALLIIFIYLNRKVEDVENKKYQYYYKKPYFIRLNKKGVIKKYNQRVLEELKEEITDAFNITELFPENDLIFDDIERGATISYIHGGKTISFLPMKFRRGFYLIGDNLHSDGASDENVYSLAYFNQTTKLPNKYLYKKEVNDKLLQLSIGKDETLYFVGFKISGVEKSFSKINKVVIEQAMQEITKEIKDLLKSKEGSLYNTEEDEFIYVYKQNSFKEVENLVLRIIKHFEKPIIISKSKIDFKVACAIVSVPSKESAHIDAKTVYSQVTETLKRAVETKHQKYVIFDELITHYLTERQLMEKELELAIEAKDFIPFFQAQYNPKEDRIVGFEALIRWDNPNYIHKSPAAFIELAEETGMINEIGQIMTEKTFELAKKFESYDVTISLNVSPIEILRQGFVDELLTLHKKYKLKPGSITLEITETTLLQSFMVINEKIRILKRNGIKIDLDDFGTGYSSLPYIKELDFDTVKIDKTFVDYIETDRYNKAIVQMIISLAKTLNASVVAEGVETKKQMDLLVKAGAHVIQGYYISKPLPYEQAKKLLDDYNVNKTKSFVKKGRN